MGTEKCIWYFSRETFKICDHLQDLGVDERIILKYIFVTVWTGFI